MSKKDIRTALISGVIASATGLPTAYPNKGVTDPVTGDPYKPSDETWLRVTILNMDDTVLTLGSGGKNRISGILQIDVFVPRNSGDIAVYDTMDDLTAVFQSGAELDYNGQVVRINSASDRAAQDESDWYRRIIDVDFYAYLTRGI